MATSRCRRLQSVAGTCSHLQPLAPATCSHLAAPWPVVGASVCEWLPSAAKWLLKQVAAKWLQVAAFSKIKLMHVCSLSVSRDNAMKHERLPPPYSTPPRPTPTSPTPVARRQEAKCAPSKMRTNTLNALHIPRSCLRR